ncbi:magnesium and cobalt transport protein CorA [Microbacterium terricola]|nr:magnesium and cobalt transport protein CorA [Microbacterium terricola]UYK41128.1 magnesium and cobalt transport protein CorA [Microbacterium terricola]
MTVIDSGVYVDGVRIASGDAPSDAIARARTNGGMAWIGLRRADGDELRVIADLLGLHPLAVQGSLAGHQRAKIEHFGKTVFVVLHPATYIDETERVESSEVDVFVGPDYIVTVQDDDDIDTDAVRQRLEAHPEVLARGPYGVVWALVEEVLSGYRPVADGVENDIDEIEEELFSDHPHVTRRIFDLQREVIDLQHATSALPDVIRRLEETLTAQGKSAGSAALRASSDRAQHVVERIDGFRHTLDAALTVHATLIEQQNNVAMRRMSEQGLAQNDQVKKISAWAAIGFAPTLVGTVYGMNFRYMPELDWVWGYPMALGLMAAVSGALYVLFRRQGWL